jgi:predicted 2-oxoglutarate/Fe(II)-dependent dioxygenase YbiX
MINPIHIKNFLSKEDCETIIKIGELHKLDYSKTKHPSNNEHYIDLNFNKRKSVFIRTDEFDIKLIEKILKKINELNVTDGLKYSHIKYFQFNKYSENDFLNYHIDSAEIKSGAIITLVIELSEGYDGADFFYRINNEEFKFEKSIGSLYIFDSNTEHKVSELISGIRYSLNLWPSFNLKTNKSLL